MGKIIARIKKCCCCWCLSNDDDQQTLLQPNQTQPQQQQRQLQRVVHTEVVSQNVTADAKSLFLELPQMTTASLSSFYKARVVTYSEPVYGNILTYVKNGQEHDFGIKVLKIVRVIQNGSRDFEHEENDQFRMMLWHGTRAEVVAQILQHGFQLPTAKNQMFGPGIYFADRVSKSCNYCDGTGPGLKAYLLLCDVSLGKIYNARKAHSEFIEAPKNFRKEFHSVMCTGKMIPNRDFNAYLNKSILPSGPTIVNAKFSQYSVQYNEYIVYDTSKIRIKYLVKVEFTSNKVL